MSGKSELSEEEFKNLKKLKILKSKVVTGSMIPIINIGDEVIVDVGKKDIKRFDIIVIFQNNKLICHFLWRKNKFVSPILFQTRSMSKNYDLPVKEEHYLGKVVSHKFTLWQKLKILF